MGQPLNCQCGHTQPDHEWWGWGECLEPGCPCERFRGTAENTFEEDARRLAESRIDPERVAEGMRSSRDAAITAWVAGWLIAAKEAAARENHDPGDEDRG